jgi:hypothetical protein
VARALTQEDTTVLLEVRQKLSALHGRSDCKGHFFCGWIALKRLLALNLKQESHGLGEAFQAFGLGLTLAICARYL